MALTAPHEATVVTTSNSTVPARPKRVSFPSMLTPAWVIPACSGLPAASAKYAQSSTPANSAAMAA